jgi:hypothetical protein
MYIIIYIYAKDKTWCLWTQLFIHFSLDNKDPEATQNTVSPQTLDLKVKKFIMNEHFLRLQ